MEIVFSIDTKTVKMTFLVNEITRDLIPEGQEPIRASYVEPMDWKLRIAFRVLRWALGDDSKVAEWTRTWNCYWEVDLSPVGGPKYNGFGNRQEAIDFEILWLNENFL